MLTEEDAEVLGNVAKCAPPLRPRHEREALWDALADGTLPMVASDHSPAPWSLKNGDDAFDAWGGISGCQTMLPLLLSEGCRARGLTLDLIARVDVGLRCPQVPPPRQGAPRAGRRRRPRARRPDRFPTAFAPRTFTTAIATARSLAGR